MKLKAKVFVMVAALLTLPVAQSSVADPQPDHALLEHPWYLLESENFSLMTNLAPDASAAADQDAGVAMLRDLEQFRKVALHVTGIQPQPKHSAMRAIVFADASQFRRIAYKTDAAGYMRPSLRGDRLVTTGPRPGIDQRVVLFHEYVHYLIKSAADTNFPAWYDEGLADMLATVVVKGEQIIVGKPSAVRLQVLTHNPYAVGLGRVISLHDLNAVHSFQLGYYLSMSWALASYLHIGHLDGAADRGKHLAQYFARLKTESDAELAFEQTFGISPQAMESDVVEFATRRNGAVLELPVSKFAYRGPVQRQVMPTSEVALELVNQALIRNPKEARKLVEAALQLDPQNVHLLSAKGVVYQQYEEFSRAEAHVREAYERKPDDPILAINYAEMLINWHRRICVEPASKQCAQMINKAKGIYARALRVAPDNAELRTAYGTLLLTRYGQFEAALPHLRYALRHQHWNSSLHFMIGLAHHGLGDRAAAIHHVENAVHWAESERKRESASAVLVQLAGNSY